MLSKANVMKIFFCFWRWLYLRCKNILCGLVSGGQCQAVRDIIMMIIGYYRWHDHPHYGWHMHYLPVGYFTIWVGGDKVLLL